jgi:transposase
MQYGVRLFDMAELPPSQIELSPVLREVLHLLIQDQESIQGASEPERAILLWSEGISESATAEELDISVESVRTLRYRWWCAAKRIETAEKKSHKAFNELVSLIFRIPNEEITSLTESDSSSVKSIHTESLTRERPADSKKLPSTTRALIEILHHKPQTYGINRSNWNQESLAVAFERLYGQRPSKSWVGRHLRDAGISWKKSLRVLTSPDPKYREKVEILLNTLQSLTIDEELFFVDELGPLQVKRYGGRDYVAKGETLTHPQNQRSRGSITMYGALSATTNQVTWFYGNTKDSTGIIDLAEILFNQYRAKSKIYLTWDAASWHGSDMLVQWIDDLNQWNADIKAGPTIEFVPLPSSAQFLDVIEAVFSGMKRAVIHNSDYESEEEMKKAISTHFRERNKFFIDNPKRAGKKIWEIDFFQDHNYIRSGNYREW